MENIEDFKRSANSLLEYQRKALAAWLYDNTTWTYEEIARISGTRLNTVRNIADDEVKIPHVQKNPISAGMITEKAFSYLLIMIKCL